METTQQLSGIKRRGFASLTPERRREIASQGGKRAHQMGRAHEFTSQEAIAASAAKRDPVISEALRAYAKRFSAMAVGDILVITELDRAYTRDLIYRQLSPMRFKTKRAGQGNVTLTRVA